MAAPKYINFDDFIFTGNDNTNATTGGGGGGYVVPTTPTTTEPSYFSSYVFTISSNQNTFDTIVNDEIRYNTKTLTIQKENLLDTSYIVKVKKEGYASNEYYLIELEAGDATLLKNAALNKTFGISTAVVVLKYYIGDSLQSTKKLTTSNSGVLEFKLNRIPITPIEEVSTQTLNIFVSGKGTPVSIVKNGTKSAQFFPTIGKSIYEDVTGTSFKISSSDLSLYKITQIEISSLTNKTETLVADSNESLEFDLKLNTDYSISIITEDVKQQIVGLNPKIKLLNSDARTYNINSRLGIPIAFEKNADVKAVTVMVGDSVLEFDVLNEGNIGGIVIPPNVFKNIGKYGIQMFPFSLKNYENQVKPETPTEVVKPKMVEPKYDVIEQVVVEQPKPSIINPYKPNIINGGDLTFGGTLGERLSQQNIK